ncbi:hypothetical protein ACG30_14845 [Listeria monocytogenes]|nr:hypothetical protein [Listeria monocytogenes]
MSQFFEGFLQILERQQHKKFYPIQYRRHGESLSLSYAISASGEIYSFHTAVPKRMKKPTRTKFITLTDDYGVKHNLSIAQLAKSSLPVEAYLQFIDMQMAKKEVHNDK